MSRQRRSWLSPLHGSLSGRVGLLVVHSGSSILSIRQTLDRPRSGEAENNRWHRDGIAAGFAAKFGRLRAYLSVRLASRSH